jgi:TatA/E family protein of Tat protein translocase
MFILFLPENPMIWLLIVGVIFLLFGGSRLPQLARALGQSKHAFKEGLEESDDIRHDQQQKPVEGRGENKRSLESIDDEALFAEARRREQLRDSEKKD